MINNKINPSYHHKYKSIKFQIKTNSNQKIIYNKYLPREKIYKKKINKLLGEKSYYRLTQELRQDYMLKIS